MCFFFFLIFICFYCFFDFYLFFVLGMALLRNSAQANLLTHRKVCPHNRHRRIIITIEGRFNYRRSKLSSLLSRPFARRVFIIQAHPDILQFEFVGVVRVYENLRCFVARHKLADFLNQYLGDLKCQLCVEIECAHHIILCYVLYLLCICFVSTLQ